MAAPSGKGGEIRALSGLVPPPEGSARAFTFVAVPPASWVSTAVANAAAFLVAGGRERCPCPRR